MAATFPDLGNTVVDGNEYVSRLAKIWKIAFKAGSIGYDLEHLGHGRAEEDDVCVLVLAEDFTFEISILPSALTWDARIKSRLVPEILNSIGDATYSSQNAMFCVSRQPTLIHLQGPEERYIIRQPIVLQHVDILFRHCTVFSQYPLT